ncbi:hypothetical protein R3P38DRAFT_2821599 [Favolaschia claudopus]|uniref:Uncharacterized protein n=1 Tax=Favolaschia claudopus TaxID=2862362 RepID=A0AAW0EE85_9AGAR
MHSTTSLTKLSTKSSRSLSIRPIVVNLDNDAGDHGDSDTLVGDLLPSDASTRPRVALRRKKHLSIYRSSAPAQSPVAEVAIEIPLVTRPQSMVTPPSVIDEVPPLFPSTKPQMTHHRAHSQPNVRLGHPSRPYYSAIRKNMSRPSSPYGSSVTASSRPSSMAFSSRTTSPTFGHLPEAFEDTDDDDETPAPSRAASPSRFAFGGVSTSHPGFSVSGEMEMRMALAALAAGQRQDSSFQFRETVTPPTTVRGRVKQLGKGLKDLVRRHAHASQ